MLLAMVSGHRLYFSASINDQGELVSFSKQDTTSQQASVNNSFPPFPPVFLQNKGEKKRIQGFSGAFLNPNQTGFSF